MKIYRVNHLHPMVWQDVAILKLNDQNIVVNYNQQP